MKTQLRKQLHAQREALSTAAVEINSMSIFQRLKTINAYQNAQHIMLYLSFGKEVMTHQIVQTLLNQGKQVFVPVPVPATKAMLASELIDPENDLSPSSMGILEPKKEALRPISPDQLDLVLVPGLAFDLNGYRIGYGAGYYDRFLPLLSPHAVTVGLAFESQIIPNTFPQAYDIPVNKIITDQTLYDVSN